MINANWITTSKDYGDICPCFCKNFKIDKTVQNAVLKVTCAGVYVAELNGKRIGNFVLAPGYTSGWFRVQFQEYDVKTLLREENTLKITVAKGWWRSRFSHIPEICEQRVGVIGELKITFKDGRDFTVSTDESWSVIESPIRFSDIYDGEIYDATLGEPSYVDRAVVYDGPNVDIIPQEGEIICEHERFEVARIIKTPKGETVIDFGQNITGYVEIKVEAEKGEVVKFTHGEVLDRDGNFYNRNYRTAKPDYMCICDRGERSYKAQATFYGFRYIRIDDFPGGIDAVNKENFTAVAVYSDIKRTGYFNCSDEKLNRFYENVLWGQRDNFLDIPTDCPQRDERLGWTGDAQIFIKTAAYNYDVEKFFIKWLRDLQLEQNENGHIFYICPTCEKLPHKDGACAGWSDAATICPSTIYNFYANREVLEEHFDMMCKWVDYIALITTTEYLWTGCNHYGDWLGIDAPQGSYKGASRVDFIASAYYAYSTALTVKAGRRLGREVGKYERLYENIVKKFRETYTEFLTQTECVLALHFGLAEEPASAAKLLADKIIKCGGHFETGFIGTAYLLHALSDNGYTELAYDLMLRSEYPSWLYSVEHGATTVWEHWDSVMEDGSFWSDDMNSFNHYAYGAAVDWLYSVAAGIKPADGGAGFERVRIEPKPSKRLDWMNASFESRQGKISSAWRKQDGIWRFEIETPVEAEIVIDGVTRNVEAGSYVFFSEI